MNGRTYMLAIDANCSPWDIEKIQQYVTDGKNFSDWWNHIPMVFVLETGMDAKSVADKFHGLAPDARFLLTEVNLASARGWLPEISWKWIGKRARFAATRQNRVRT